MIEPLYSRNRIRRKFREGIQALATGFVMAAVGIAAPALVQAQTLTIGLPAGPQSMDPH